MLFCTLGMKTFASACPMFLASAEHEVTSMKISCHTWSHKLRLLVKSWLSIVNGLGFWNGLLKWTTGLTFFALKIIFIAYNKIFLLVHAYTSLATSFFLFLQ